MLGWKWKRAADEKEAMCVQYRELIIFYQGKLSALYAAEMARLEGEKRMADLREAEVLVVEAMHRRDAAQTENSPGLAAAIFLAGADNLTRAQEDALLSLASELQPPTRELVDYGALSNVINTIFRKDAEPI